MIQIYIIILIMYFSLFFLSNWFCSDEMYLTLFVAFIFQIGFIPLIGEASALDYFGYSFNTHPTLKFLHKFNLRYNSYSFYIKYCNFIDMYEFCVRYSNFIIIIIIMYEFCVQ